eukprot:TRINITY_DN34655_c0_g1_i1.p2 TRINITY_DN34655_c0_g1~~TRINITY_DN34655_c0_g1_i1.p2  ORF type:complete len:183 (-),score=17.78 TRINITY_DN34655_c0_g1_i1:142-690(-)
MQDERVSYPFEVIDDNVYANQFGVDKMERFERGAINSNEEYLYDENEQELDIGLNFCTNLNSQFGIFRLSRRICDAPKQVLEVVPVVEPQSEPQMEFSLGPLVEPQQETYVDHNQINFEINETTEVIEESRPQTFTRPEIFNELPNDTTIYGNLVVPNKGVATAVLKLCILLVIIFCYIVIM